MNSETYTLEHLSQATLSELDELTRNAAGALGVSRLWMGRCLVALSEGNRAGQMGYSGAMHLAKLLGVGLIAVSLEPEERVVAKIHREAELDIAAMEAPWAAVGCEEQASPSDPQVSLVRPSRVPHWQNSRLAFNQESRHTTPAQRAELLRRDGYRCATPECPNHLWLQVHHIVFYCRGGATVPANMTVCCGSCHRNIHDRHLFVNGSAPNGLHWRTASGETLEAVVPNPSGGLVFVKAGQLESSGSP